jgi:hypothetical protein
MGNSDRRNAGLSALDLGLAAAQFAAPFLGSPMGVPPSATAGDAVAPSAVVAAAEPQDWVYDLAALQQEELIERGNEAEALSEPEYSDQAPPESDPGAQGGML